LLLWYELRNVSLQIRAFFGYCETWQRGSFVMAAFRKAKLTFGFYARIIKLAMKGFWRSALILLQPVIICMDTVRSVCDIRIYGTTERIFSKLMFRGKLRFGTNGSLLYSLISSQKIYFNRKANVKNWWWWFWKLREIY
jgi:hypothetical protein